MNRTAIIRQTGNLTLDKTQRFEYIACKQNCKNRAASYALFSDIILHVNSWVCIVMQRMHDSYSYVEKKAVFVWFTTFSDIRPKRLNQTWKAFYFTSLTALSGVFRFMWGRVISTGVLKHEHSVLRWFYIDWFSLCVSPWWHPACFYGLIKHLLRYCGNL